MGRLLFWLVLGFAFWYVVRIMLFASRKHDGEPSTKKGGAKSSAVPEQTPMLQCAYCGVHFPETEGVSGEDGRVFCSAPHRQLAYQPK